MPSTPIPLAGTIEARCSVKKSNTIGSSNEKGSGFMSIGVKAGKSANSRLGAATEEAELLLQPPGRSLALG